MDFEERMQKAIRRGERASDQRAEAQAAKALNEEELKRLHTQYRLELSERIEKCISILPDHFPGFRYETIVGERGWGAGVSRDDVDLGGAGRRNLYSRLEMSIRPFTSYHAIELVAKGTIRNKELFNRSHFQRLTEVSSDDFSELIDLWVLEYTELYARKN